MQTDQHFDSQHKPKISMVITTATGVYNDKNVAITNTLHTSGRRKTLEPLPSTKCANDWSSLTKAQHMVIITMCGIIGKSADWHSNKSLCCSI